MPQAQASGRPRSRESRPGGWRDGNVSFDDCDAFGSSFGRISRPSRSPARFASTSFMFMLVEVPDPVWNTSIGNWSKCRPAATSSAASAIASPTSAEIVPISAFTVAAAPLIMARAVEERRLDDLTRDREVLDRSLGLGAPAGCLGNADLAHRVVLDPIP